MNEYMIAYKTVADSMGIPVFAYEDGQSLAAAGGFIQANECATELMISANRSPRMQDIYCQYHDYLFDSLSCGLHMSFVLAAPHSPYGAYGIVESQWQDFNNSPKWRAFVNGCSGSTPRQRLSVSLVNAQTNQILRTLSTNGAINLADIGTDSLTFQVNDPDNQFESMDMQLTGPISFRQTESVQPYTLFGDSPGQNFNGRAFPPGNYTLTVTPYNENGLRGTAGTPLQLSFSIVNNTNSLAISQLVLVNADTDQDIQVLNQGDQIDLANIGTSNLSIRAEVTGGQAGSVALGLNSSTLSHSQIENIAPFALFGDEMGRDFIGRNLNTGQYTIIATPYTQSNQGGDVGMTTEISFTLTRDLINQLAWVDVRDPQSNRGTIEDGMRFSCPAPMTFIANATANVESVRFTLISTTDTIDRVENIPPYTLLGETRTGDFIPWNPQAGTYQLIVTPYMQNQAQGIAGDTEIYNFLVDGDFNIRQVLLVNAATDEYITPMQNNISFPLPTGGVSMRADVGTCVERVNFEMRRGSATGAIEFSRNENIAPYSLVGDDGPLDFFPWNPAPGNYTVIIRTFDSGDASAVAIDQEILSFTVEGQNISSAASVDLFPNPGGQDEVHLEFDRRRETRVSLIDSQGNIVMTTETSLSAIDLNTKDLSPGFYIIEIRTEEGVMRKRWLKY